MIELKDMTMDSFLYKAIENVHANRFSQLISWTEEIKPLDILALFDAAEKLHKDRIYWTNSSNDFTLFGIGSVHKIISEDQRFRELEDKWREIKEQAMIYNPFTEVGTGLLAIGGSSFDPKSSKGKLWKKYPTSQMTVPEYIIIQNKDRYFMTINRYVDGTMTAQNLAKEIDKEKEMIFSVKTIKKSNPQKVVSKKEIEPEQWKRTVKEAVNNIQQNEVKKIVLARELRIKLNQKAKVGNMLKRLRETQPNSYIFVFEHEDNCFLGASPERLVKVKGKRILSTCLAGTAPRGKTAKEDQQIAEALMNDQKNREEHDYVVQMIRQNIEKYCENIKIPKEPVVYPLRNLQHLYTPVTATLKNNSTVFDIIENLHPTPALGGLPRKKALQFIREKELLDRGWYGAPIGWIDSQSNSEFAVAIRSGLVQGDEISLFAGCGVMRDSDPEMEYEETNVKFLPMLTVLEDTNEPY